MSANITNDRAILGIHPTKESAEAEARLIVATHVDIVTLYPRQPSGSIGSELKPLGYLCVPSEHKCPACGRYDRSPV